MNKRKRAERVLVTGGAGFIASLVVDRLVAEGCEVSVLDNLSRGNVGNIKAHVEEGKVSLAKGDIRDIRTVSRLARRIDAIVHEAGLVNVGTSLDKPVLVNDVNVGGTLNLLDAARRSQVKRFVFASSCAVYGEAKRVPIPENAELLPVSPYGASKLAAETYCLAFHRAYGLDTVCLRYFNVFGPRQSLGQYTSVIDQFITDLARGRRPTVFGDGQQTRDFVNVANVATATIQVLRARGIAGEVFNVGTGKATSVISLLRKVQAIASVGFLRPKHRTAKPGEIRRSVADITKAREKLGHRPTTNPQRDV